jgi:HK97 family phage prohead protease
VSANFSDTKKGDEAVSRLSDNLDFLEYRSIPEVRADRTHIVGYALVFDVRSRDLGGFVEIIRPSAVDRTMTAGADIVALFNHNQDAVLGRTPKTLQLTKDTRGLAFELDPPGTQAGRDALELVTRGDVRGASFGFQTRKDHWQREHGTMVRELLDIEIAEISLTAFPAYRETDVAVAQRSLQAFQVHHGQSVAWLRLRHTARGA